MAWDPQEMQEQVAHTRNNTQVSNTKGGETPKWTEIKNLDKNKVACVVWDIARNGTILKQR
ncbi:hypothetical protein BLOT_010701 [Blomia tropicalis]|nr:hypothetical protein BLOT_010701 [Blomia tropicalis]